MAEDKAMAIAPINYSAETTNIEMVAITPAFDKATELAMLSNDRVASLQLDVDESDGSVVEFRIGLHMIQAFRTSFIGEMVAIDTDGKESVLDVQMVSARSFIDAMAQLVDRSCGHLLTFDAKPVAEGTCSVSRAMQALSAGR